MRSAPFEWEETLPFQPAELGCEPGSELSPVTVQGRLSEVDPDLWLELEIAFRVAPPCDRCARPAPTEVRSSHRLLVTRIGGADRRSRGRAGDTEEVELSEDELGVLEVAGEELDTRALVAEQAQLELPTRPLCREQCRGLCPVCGGDRNERECDCARAAGDPRWASLAGWKDRRQAE